MLKKEYIRWQMVAQSPTGEKMVVSADEGPTKFDNSLPDAHHLIFQRGVTVAVDNLVVGPSLPTKQIEIIIPFGYCIYFINPGNFIAPKDGQ